MTRSTDGLTLSEFKERARRLAGEMGAAGAGEPGHMRALEILSRTHGYADWHAARSALSNPERDKNNWIEAPRPLTLGDGIDPVEFEAIRSAAQTALSSPFTDESWKDMRTLSLCWDRVPRAARVRPDGAIPSMPRIIRGVRIESRGDDPFEIEALTAIVSEMPARLLMEVGSIFSNTNEWCSYEVRLKDTGSSEPDLSGFLAEFEAWMHEAEFGCNGIHVSWRDKMVSGCAWHSKTARHYWTVDPYDL